MLQIEIAADWDGWRLTCLLIGITVNLNTCWLGWQLTGTGQMISSDFKWFWENYKIFKYITCINHNPVTFVGYLIV